LDFVRTAGAFFLAAIAAWAFGEPVIGWIRSLKLRAEPREDVPAAHGKKAGTPSMGGLFLVPAALVGMVFAIWRPEVIGVGLFCVLFGVLGCVDDYLKGSGRAGRGMMARHKLLVQALLGCGIAVYACAILGRGTVVELPGGKQVDLQWGFYVFGALVAMAVSNAVNLTDGLDGLAAGVAIPPLFAYMTLALFAATAAPSIGLGNAIAAAALAGACAGFLRFNRLPARVWMGDTGSMALGGALAALAIFTRLEWLLLLAGLVFVVEALSVIIQVISFQTTGKRIFRMSPLHHHFELAGHSEARVVTGFWIASLVCSCLGIALGYAVALAGG